MTEKQVFKTLPAEGVRVSASKGNRISRINLDMAEDGITLAMVGAASALKAGNLHTLTLSPGKEGIVLSVVGAATAAR
ncbi:hypothetical protein [Mesorhizobium sp. L2C084A000]|uniref:hypothetical protein n=1 Tax=Mesorhizobium sp. L2C084A000 TaxID=1287116 RepID=UPI0012DD7DC1|nr:hypothetical protein [Mesorhizobium sp. L2C084A000]